jgi:transposase InsO family protein
MNEEEKKEVGVFRFGVIADFVTGAHLPRGEKQRLLREKSARRWTIPFSDRSYIAEGTIREWIRKYLESGRQLESLYPRMRGDKGSSRTIDPETAANLECLRKEQPKDTLTSLIETMDERRLITPGTRLNKSNVWRYLSGQGLMALNQNEPTDRRKFEAELPNDLWQSDVMHGPKLLVDGVHRKTYLIAFIDDHTRLIPHGAFYLSEKLQCFLEALEKALLKRGLPRKLYVDNGAAYRSKQLEHICASIGIALIRAKPYQPQGKGKIERFFRTVRSQCLPTFDPSFTLEGANDAFKRWVEKYHQSLHSAIGTTPLERFAQSMECLRPAPEDLREHFRIVVRRSVAKDRTVTINGRLFEAPVALVGKRIDLLYHKEKPQQVEARLKNHSYGLLRPVDLAVNCKVKRDRNRNTQISTQDSTPPEGGKIW